MSGNHTITTGLHSRRQKLLGSGSSTFYREPVTLVRGAGVWVWDDRGRRYLDTYNNVPHVGHCHPRVVEAICQQTGTLNTHTRYLHPGIVDYAEKLTAMFDDSLDAMTMTCTGSEANDLALRIAQATTGYTGVVCTSATYHGNTTAVSQLSATRPPLGGRGQHICQVSPPNELEPIGADAGLSQAQAFARQVSDAVLELQKRKCGLSALILCPLFANEGFPTLERGFLDETVSIVRANGGVIIADEVQCGFGRTGNHYWGHEKLGFVPDIITLGKPIANGYPVGAVVTRADYLALFQENYRYFNTFGGNPVACAAANATLDVLVEEELKENARVVGAYALEQLHQIKANHPIVASVRGAGLFFGAELDRQLVPNIDAKDIAAAVSETMKDAGVLTGISGWHRTILKMRPPLPYARDHVDMLIDTLDKALSQVMSSLDKNGSRAAKPIRQKTDSAPRKTRAPKDKSAPIGKTTTKNEMKSSQQVKAVDETANKTTSQAKATVDVTATRRQAAAKGEVSTKDGVASRRKASVDVVSDKVGVGSRRKAAVKGKVSTKVGVASRRKATAKGVASTKDGVASRRKAAVKGVASTKVGVASRRKAAVKGVASTKDGVASRRKAVAQGKVSTKVSVASRRKAAAKGVASTKDGVASRRKAVAVDEAATKDGLKRKRKTPYISKAMARRQAAILDDMAPQNRAFVPVEAAQEIESVLRPQAAPQSVPAPLHSQAITLSKYWLGRQPQLKLLSHRENTVYFAQDKKGKAIVLRLLRWGYNNWAELDSEVLWLKHLHHEGVGVAAPLASKRDRYLHKYTHNGTSLHANASTVIDGSSFEEVLAKTPAKESAPLWHALGRLIAQLHQASDSLDTSGNFRRRHWNLAALLGRAPLWGLFWQSSLLNSLQMKTMRRIKDKAFKAMEELIVRHSDYGLIHSDLNAQNILCRRNGDDWHMTAIDFDDGGFGFRIYDLLIALFAYNDSVHYSAYRTALFDGYTSVRKMVIPTECECRVLLAVRAMSLLGWVSSRLGDCDDEERPKRAVDRALRLAESFDHYC